jgi:small subunit ribosomal protein S6
VREYESTLIIQPEISDDGVAALRERLDGVLAGFGAIRLLYDDLGKRRLAYEIQNFQKGRYVMLQFLDDGSNVKAIERALGLEDSIIRFLTVQVSDAVEDVAARRSEAAEEERIRAEKAAERAAREAEEAARQQAEASDEESQDAADADSDDTSDDEESSESAAPTRKRKAAAESGTTATSAESRPSRAGCDRALARRRASRARKRASCAARSAASAQTRRCRSTTRTQRRCACSRPRSAR